MQDKGKERYPSTFTVDQFSSTTKLGPQDLKIPVGSNETINEKDDLYSPFDHRPTEHSNSSAGSLIHLVKSSLGTGILAMPNAFKNGGLVFGFIGTLVVGLLCTHCVHILVKASHEMSRKRKVPSLGFSQTAGAVFENGPKACRPWAKAAEIFVNIALCVTYFMGGSVYVVFVSESIQKVVEARDLVDWSIYVYIALVLGPLILTCQLRELKYLVPFSFLANVFMVVSFAITLKFMFTGIEGTDDRDMVSSIGNLPVFFSTVIFAMEGIGVVMPVENSMRKPQQFLGCPGVLNIAMSIVVALYSVIGFFGYLRFGDKTQASVTYNLPDGDVWAEIAKIFIALAVFFTYSLQFHVPMEITWKMVLEKRIPQKYHNLSQIGIRSAIVTLSAGIAAAVPNLEPIIGLVGSICLSTLGLFIPAVVDTVLMWDGRLGVFKWRLIKNTILCCFSIFALISGTIFAVQDLIKG